MHPYHESPKVIIIAGPRCSGKTYTSEEIARELGFACISQDHLRLDIEKEQNLSSEELFHPASKPHYKKAFMKKLREIRFSDIVIEGARLSLPFVYEAFVEALIIEYGQYVISKSFFLVPPMEVRYDRYAERIKRVIKRFEKEKKSNNPDRKELKRLAGAITSSFDAFPIPPDRAIFETVESADPIFAWIHDHLEDIHPHYPVEHAELIGKIASSSTNYSPFYQTVDIKNQRIIQGQTQSHYTWENITKLGIDWKGKRVCEIGCNNGYFLFKAEEAGAECVGYDVNQGSIDTANAIKQYVSSQTLFEIKNVSNSFEDENDVLLALNMLHYIENLEELVTKLAQQSNEIVLEIGEKQIEQILPVIIKNGHALRKTLPSHRQQGVLGRRVILHFAKAETSRKAA
jgi:cytidylate kinase/SAM-dependent methyltransferase